MARSTPFVGRAHPLRILGGAFRAAPLEGLHGVVVAGPAGIGKSRLLSEFFADAPEVGARATGGCVVDDHQLAPLRPIREVLDGLGAEDAVHPNTASEEQGYRFWCIAEALRDAAREAGQLTLALEDLHWADTTSLQLLRFLVRTLAQEPILLVATHRDGHEVRPPLRDLLTAFDRAPNTVRLDLPPLSRTEVAAMAEHRVGHELEDAALDRLEARSEGLPLFVEELLATGELAPDLPGPVRDLFLAQLGRVGACARTVIEHAAVCGGDVRDELLEEVTDVEPQELDAALDELLGAGLLVGSGTRYRFRHALLHETVYGHVRPTVRRRTHRRCAEALTERPHLASPARSLPATLADHWREAGEPLPALLNLLEAAEDACEMRAYAEALHYELSAVELAEQVPPELRPGLTANGLRARAAYTAGRAGDHDQEVALLERAVADTDHPAARSALSVQLAAARYLVGDPMGAASTASTALEELTPGAPPEVRALLLAISAHLRRDAAGLSAPVQATTEALDLAREAGNLEVLCSVLCAHGLAQATSGDVVGARSSLEEAERLTNLVSDPRTAIRPDVYRMLLLQRLGAAREVVLLGREAIVRADRSGVGRGAGQQLRAILVDALTGIGAWDEAFATIDDALAWGDRGVSGMRLLLARAELAIWRGDFAEAERELSTVRDRDETGHPRYALVAAELSWWRRDPVGTRYHASRGLDVAAFGGPDELGALTFALARSLVMPGSRPTREDRQRLQATLEGLAAAGDQPVVRAWRATAHAELAESDRRPSAWEEARAAWQAAEHVPMLAHASWRTGQAHLDVGDRGTARSILLAAHDLADELGARPMLVEIRAALGTTGGDPTRGAQAPTALADAESRFGLTRREREVLGLVARGWTNKRIGAALSVSPRTIGTHVSNILDKLGVSTRGEAVAKMFQAPRSPGDGAGEGTPASDPGSSPRRP